MLIANWPGRLLSASQLSQVHFLYHIVTSEERNCSACLTLRPSHRKSSSWSLAKFECNIVLCFCLLWHVCLLRKAAEKTNLFVISDYFLAQRTSFLLLELWISQIFSVRPSDMFGSQVGASQLSFCNRILIFIRNRLIVQNKEIFMNERGRHRRRWFREIAFGQCIISEMI